MRRFRASIGAALAIALLGPSLPSRAQAPAAHTVDVTQATLANGLRVVVLRDTLAPVVATYMNYLTGSDDEPIEGLAHAQEHMMFRGSKTVDASQFSASTAVTGGTFNADTQNEITQYFFEMPSQDLDIALNLERSRAQGLLDAQSEWNQERGAITQEVTRDNSSSSYRLYDKAIRHVFAGTPYADPGLGTVAAFKRIKAVDLQAFYRRWYHPNNAILVIAGNVEAQPTIEKVRALFGSIPAVPVPAHRSVTLPPLHAATYRDNSSDPLVSVFVGYRVPGYDSPDYYASEILNDVLNSQRGALYELVASGKALFTSAQSQTYPAAGLTLIGSYVPVTTKGDQAVADVQAVIEGYKKNGLPADLVEVAKRREVAQAEFARNSINGLATLWSQELAVEHRTPDDELAGLQKVTVDDVNRVLRTSYDNATAVVGISTPKEAAGSAFGEKAGEDNTVVPKQNTKLPAFARSVLANLHVPEKTVHPQMETLPNGLKLIVVPSQISHTVTLAGIILNNAGVQDPAGKEGIGGLLGGLFSYGTTTYARIPLQVELDKIAANLQAGTTFGTSVLSSDFDRAVALLADDELRPALPADAFAIVKQQQIGQLTGTVQSPDYKAQRALSAALYPAGDPSRRSATPQSVSGITLDDVKAFYAKTYRPDLTTIAVIGDVTPEHARAIVEQNFGAWKTDGPTPDIFPALVPNNKPARAVIPATGRIQAEVTLGETVPISYSNPDFPLLDLANTVLSGGFYASLLYHDVREVHGYAYTVGSQLGGGHNRSSFSVNFGADPRNVDNATRLIENDLDGLQKKPLDADRLLRAKALTVGALPISGESYDGVAGQLIEYAATGRPLDEDRRQAAAELAATPQSVRAAFAKWIRPHDFVRVVVGPAK